MDRTQGLKNKSRVDVRDKQLQGPKMLADTKTGNSGELLTLCLLPRPPPDTYALSKAGLMDKTDSLSMSTPLPCNTPKSETGPPCTGQHDIGFTNFDLAVASSPHHYTLSPHPSVTHFRESFHANEYDRSMASGYPPPSRESRGTSEWNRLPVFDSKQVYNHVPALNQPPRQIMQDAEDTFSYVKSMDHKMNALLERIAMMESAPTQTAKPDNVQAGPLDYQANRNRTSYWFHDEWKAAQQKAAGKTNQDKSVSSDHNMGFLKDHEGQIPSSTEREKICRTTRGIFNEFLEENAAPATWSSGATIEQRKRFRFEIESEHELFRLCDDGWKAELLATKLYPQFKLTHQRRFNKTSGGTDEQKSYPKWLQSDKRGKQASNEGSVDPGAPSRSSRKRKNTAPKSIAVAEEAHVPKRRAPLNVVNTITTSRATATAVSSQSESTVAPLAPLRTPENIATPSSEENQQPTMPQAASTVNSSHEEMSSDAQVYDGLDDASGIVTQPDRSTVVATLKTASAPVQGPAADVSISTQVTVTKNQSSVQESLHATESQAAQPATDLPSAGLSDADPSTHTPTAVDATGAIVKRSTGKLFTPEKNPEGTCSAFKAYWKECQDSQERLQMKLQRYQDSRKEAAVVAVVVMVAVMERIEDSE
ncbi:hypothetical protein BDY19DRAFT_908986 [Irpex rosettiformis]|uniref:Uncharacterized protein n=1 Tax=Irpex rosettiformis TaxID=378272 RepID=A0ACB8TU24_9APHY|nr:hypothetical protein BDY19DRAFT_908986 [Irpex rosettiformis]